MKIFKVNNIKKIDMFDIFDLIGLGSLPQEDKKEYLIVLNRQILKEFLLKTIFHIKDNEVLVNLQMMVDQQKDPDIVLEYMSSRLPNFFKSLVDFVRQKKELLVLDYLEKILFNLDTRIRHTTAQQAIIRIKEEINYYVKAQKLAQKKEWGQLKIFLSQKITTSIPTNEKS